jgi:pyruvate-formate lyase
MSEDFKSLQENILLIHIADIMRKVVAKKKATIKGAQQAQWYTYNWSFIVNIDGKYEKKRYEKFIWINGKEPLHI